MAFRSAADRPSASRYGSRYNDKVAARTLEMEEGRQLRATLQLSVAVMVWNHASQHKPEGQIKNGDASNYPERHFHN
jgi:hypothetical protein